MYRKLLESLEVIGFIGKCFTDQFFLTGVWCLWYLTLKCWDFFCNCWKFMLC